VRLHIPMNATLRVRERQRGGRVNARLKSLLQGWNMLLLSRPDRQISPTGPLQHHEVTAHVFAPGIGIRAEAIGLQHLQNVGVIQPRHLLTAPPEAQQALRIAGQAGVQDLEHHALTTRQSLRQPDAGKSPLPEALRQSEATVNDVRWLQISLQQAIAKVGGLLSGLQDDGFRGMLLLQRI